MSTFDIRQLQSPSASSEASQDEFDRAGEVIDGRYRLERLIACGGSGMIYLSTELPSQQRSAVKVIATRLKQFDHELADRFREDAQRCARLIHPSIAMIYDYGETERGDLFIAMELVDGRPLAQVIAVEGPLPIERILRIAVRVARALKHAHDHGVLHRDLKPSKILMLGDELDGDQLKLIDVGVAGLLVGERGRWGIADSQDSPFGSPKYLSPEQIRGEMLDARSDMYAFGALLFCMITGVPPFLGSRAIEIAEQHLRARPPAMESVGYKRSVPHPVFAIVSRCLEKARENRFSSMKQLISELKIAYQASVGKPLRLDDSGYEDIDESTGHTPLPALEDDGYYADPMSSRTVSDTETATRERRVEHDLAEAMRMAKRVAPMPEPSLVSQRAMTPPPPIRAATTPPSMRAVTPPPPVPPASLLPPSQLMTPSSVSPLAPTMATISMPMQPAAHAAPIVISRPTRVPWIIAAISLLTAIAAVASLVFAPDRGSPQPAPDPKTEMFDETRIAFESVPPGARVEEQGVILGVTPFIRSYPRGEETRTFLFVHDGYQPGQKQTAMSASQTVLRVVLQKNP